MPASLQTASAVVANLTETLRNVEALNPLLDRLDHAIPSSRAQRAPNVKVNTVAIKTTVLPNGSGTPTQVSAKTGDQGQYDTRINLSPKQGFHCTCPDLQQRRLACKHVAALAVETRKRFWAIQGVIEGDVERLSIQLTELESAVDTLTSHAQGALESTLKALES
jgi:hypothetical protein